MKKIICVAIMLALLLTGCSKPKEVEPVSTSDIGDDWKYGGSIRLACVPVDTLNPLMTKHATVMDFLSLVYEGLFECLPDHTAKPVLASEYSVSENNTVYTIKLKSGIKFHSGKSFSAEDVIATLDYIFLYGERYTSIRENVLVYVATANDTVVVTLKNPVADFMNCFDFPILPAGLMGNDFLAETSGFSPDGTGMYVYNGTDDYKNIYLKANTAWHGEKGAPYISEVNVQILSDADTVISAFDAGVIDVLTTSWKSPAEIGLTSSVYNTFVTEQNKLTFIGINCACADFDTVEERLNLNNAIDGVAITEDIMSDNAVAANAPLREKVYFNGKTYDEHDSSPRKPSSFVADSGDESGVILLYNSDSKIKELLAQNLKYILETKGHKVILDPQPYENYCMKVLGSQYDLYIGEVKIDNSGNLEFMFGTLRGGQNICSYSSVELANSISNLNRMDARDSREVAWKNFKKYYLDTVFQIPLYFTNGCTYVNKRIYGELTPNLSAMLSGFENLYVHSRETME